MPDLRRLLTLAGRTAGGVLAEGQIAPAFAGGDTSALATLAEQGFDTSHPLYHGSPKDFTAFDRSFNRTANDIYTSPDPNTAGSYGQHLYLCVGRMDPQADLIDDYRLLGKLAADYAEDFYDAVSSDEGLEELRGSIHQELLADDPDAAEWDAEADPRYVALLDRTARGYVVDHLQSGELYGFKGGFQDTVMTNLFAEGYRSVRFSDPALSDGGESVSIVFEDAANVVIVRKIR